MAIMKHTGDRRSFLAAGMGTIVAVGASPAALASVLDSRAGGRSAWDAAMARLNHADKVMWAKSHEIDRMSRDDPNWMRANDELEDLVEAFSDAETAVLDTPAPDRAALRWKLDRILDGGIEGPWTESYSAEFIRQTVADYRRLLGDA